MASWIDWLANLFAQRSVGTGPEDEYLNAVPVDPKGTAGVTRAQRGINQDPEMIIPVPPLQQYDKNQYNQTPDDRNSPRYQPYPFKLTSAEDPTALLARYFASMGHRRG